MSKHVLSYRAAQHYSSGSPETMAAWNAWFASLGGNVADWGDQISERRVLGDAIVETVLAGYLVITADDLDSAVSLAKGAPACSMASSSK